MFEPNAAGWARAEPSAALFDARPAAQTGKPGFQARPPASAPLPDQHATPPAPDPRLAEAYDAGHADGQAQAQAMVASAVAEAIIAERRASAALADAVARLACPAPDALARALAARLGQALREAAGAAAVDDALLFARATDAVALARADAPDAAMSLFLHPDDAGRLEMAGAGAALGVVLVRDAAMAPGSLRLAAGAMTVTDGVADHAAATAACWAASAGNEGA